LTKASAVSERKPSEVIVVVGMMGAGKTTVGRALARILNVPAIDSDDLIADRAGMPAAEQLRVDAQTFRRIEAECIQGALQRNERCVLSIGGGAPATPAVADALRVHAPVVWIRVPEDELLRRVMSHGNDRPMLDGDPKARLQKLLQERTPQYEDIASEIVDGVGSPDVVAQRIVGAIQ
jgi:shikimate kinase